MSATIDAPTPPRPSNAAAAGAVAGDVFARLAASWLAEAGGAASPALAREVAAHVRALLAAFAYERTGAPAGWQRFTPDDLRAGIVVDAGGAPLTLRPRGFDLARDSILPGARRHRAVLYRQGDAPHFVLAFEGSGSDVWRRGMFGPDIVDWVNNFSQGLGQASPFYDAALAVAREVQTGLGGRAELELAGHSLGGGMAAYASILTGLPATVFNAAGVSPTRLREAGAGPDAAADLIGGRPLVEAYVVEGDILNTEVLALGRALLGGTAPVAVGAAYRIDNPEAPFGFGALFDLDPKIEAHVDYVPLLQEQIFSRAAQALGRVPALS